MTPFSWKPLLCIVAFIYSGHETRASTTSSRGEEFKQQKGSIERGSYDHTESKQTVTDQTGRVRARECQPEDGSADE